jgi:metallophosphoesterase (TIGR00282 family)
MLVGDVVGRPGRKAVCHWLPRLIDEHSIDFVVVNAENAAAGFGITLGLAHDLLDAGADCLTMGNHVWSQKGTDQLLEIEPRVLRPANYPPQCAGVGARLYSARCGNNVGVINLQGRVFMGELDCPFRAADAQIELLCRQGAEAILVDFHAEATSEKLAMGRYLDGRIAAMVGTHTHVMTADEQILPGGSAYITDLGMTGPVEDTIIGVQAKEVMTRFLTLMPQRFIVPKQSESRFGAVIVDYCLDTRRAKHIQRIEKYMSNDKY